MKLQLALDTPDLAHELELAGKVAAHVDLIEAGTPLLIREGIRAVRELRRRHRGRPIVADIKVIDAGEPIAELAFASGASIVTVLGCASDEVIERVVKSARRYDGKVMADSLSVPNIVERSKQLADLGVDSLCINRRGFKRAKSREERIAQIHDLISTIQLPVFLAGGIDLAELAHLRKLPLAGVIVGACIADADSPAAMAEKMRALLDWRE
ncbi:MAG: orotidine 5'-phosphate decarboxylase [Acidobacteria bacterium]|nr:orotidine 5'-phosphate decarboxylase [Acidobacteriota bacterium]MBK8312893.1 orotidine 5'-phosphate decarboxylase [Acidobacteriota bacterium]